MWGPGRAWHVARPREGPGASSTRERQGPAAAGRRARQGSGGGGGGWHVGWLRGGAQLQWEGQR
jgi:hypothetical protein